MHTPNPGLYLCGSPAVYMFPVLGLVRKGRKSSSWLLMYWAVWSRSSWMLREQLRPVSWSSIARYMQWPSDKISLICSCFSASFCLSFSPSWCLDPDRFSTSASAMRFSRSFSWAAFLSWKTSHKTLSHCMASGNGGQLRLYHVLLSALLNCGVWLVQRCSFEIFYNITGVGLRERFDSKDSFTGTCKQL